MGTLLQFYFLPWQHRWVGLLDGGLWSRTAGRDGIIRRKVRRSDRIPASQPWNRTLALSPVL